MLFQNNKIDKNISFGSNLYNFFIFYVIFSSICSIRTVQGRSIDGSDNNALFPDHGKPSQTYLREFPSDPFYPNGKGKMLKTPTDNENVGSMVKCTDPLPEGTYPLPRCISNEFGYNYNLDPSDVKQRLELRSKRGISHMATWFGQYISFDLTGSSSKNIKSDPLYIPADDAKYNPPNSITFTSAMFPFNLSDTYNPDPQNSVRNGIGAATPFLDLNMIYGLSDDQLANDLRDGASCKLLTSNNGKYPAKGVNGSYKSGVPLRNWSLFTLAINTVWIREHNYQCDELFKQHGNSWTDQQYFEEARRWNIALFQKTVSEEYLGAITGRPLPAYGGYKQEIVPGIDIFFATVALKYGHTELSDYYRIQDEYGDTIADLTLNQIINNQNIIETYGLSRVLGSMALQRQEQVDIFVGDATRNVNVNIAEPNHYYDLLSFDILRSRDHGISLYNTVREAYGLLRKNTWNEVTSNQKLQNRLQLLYPNGPDSAESFVGVLCEDHLGGASFGELLNASIVTQFNRIRESDRFWWENPGMFSESEIEILRSTTFRDIIVRNLKIDEDDNYSQFVRNIWMIHPQTELENGKDDEYKTSIIPWTDYSIRYRLDSTRIYFKVELQTAGGEGWFGMGFDPSDQGMKEAEFIVGIVKDNDIDLSNYVAAVAGYHPPVRENSEGLEIKKKSVTSGKATIEFSRLLNPSNRKPIRHEQMKYIMAYNPTSSVFGYHMHNRQMVLIDFYKTEVSAAIVSGSQKTRLFHGLAMIFAWCVLFPISIFIVRFRKHTNNYLKIHRIIQLLGGMSVSTFGAAAISTMTTNNKSSHAWMGLFVYSMVFFQLALGFIAIWGQATIVSVNQGYPRFVKRFHQGFGALLLLTSWITIYFGITTFTQSYGLQSQVWTIAYFILISILIIVFFAGECWRRRANELICQKEKEVEACDKKQLLRSYIDYKDYDKLPEFTWEEINERVQRGASLVVCDELIVDIRKWIRVHPGGAKILERVIGTDITNDFYNTRKEMNIVEDVETEQLMLYTKNEDNNTSIFDKYHDARPSTENTSILKKLHNVAKAIDNINLKYISKSPLAIHSHSAFATKKMAEMVIGKMAKPLVEDQSQNSLSIGPKEIKNGRRSSKYFGLDDENMMIQDFTQRIKFRRYKLTSKSAVSSNVKYPVIRFTFTKVHQDEKDVWDKNFLPGHYIEVQSRIKGQVVIRCYTPIEGKMSKSFSIYVKIYPTGLMSTHLHEQLIGFEIQVRGPFDVSDRFGITNVSGQGEILNTPILRKRGSILSQFAAKSSLLNPNNSLDGCWEELFMICRGTGITPMLQLIKYHISCIRKSHSAGQKNRRINMYLLFSNNRIEDVIDGIRLQEYALSSRGMLTVSIILLEPPDDFVGRIGGLSGLQGEITSETLQKWFSDIKFTTPTTSVTSQYRAGDTYMRLRKYDIPRPQTIIKDDVPQTPTSQKSYFQEESPIIFESPQDIRSPIMSYMSYHPSQNQQESCDRTDSRMSPNRLQSKIIVCGPMDMMMTVEQTLIDIGYSEKDYILLV